MLFLILAHLNLQHFMEHDCHQYVHEYCSVQKANFEQAYARNQYKTGLDQTNPVFERELLRFW